MLAENFLRERFSKLGQIIRQPTVVAYFVEVTFKIEENLVKIWLVMSRIHALWFF